MLLIGDCEQAARMAESGLFVCLVAFFWPLKNSCRLQLDEGFLG